MKRVTVGSQSSLLESVKYRSKTENLNITFHNGKTYRYFDVPKSVYEGLLKDDSKGAYFNEVIKPNFDYEEV